MAAKLLTRTPLRLPGWPEFDDEQIEAVAAVLRSGRVNYWRGDCGRQFEQRLAAWCGTRYAASVASGTAALELALRALGIGPGDEVIVPARSFIATASAVVVCGAIPVFCDIDEESQNLTAGTVNAALTPRTRAIIAVHLSGWPCDMPPLMELAAQRGLLVIEDCAQALGAFVDGRSVGSFGNAAAFSFCQDKILSTGGEGGMMLCHDATVWERACAYRDHGRNATATVEAGPRYRWIHDTIGTNWRLTECQAAIGLVQLRRLERWVRRRQRNTRLLTEALAGVTAFRIPTAPDRMRHAGYRLAMTVRPQRFRTNWDRDRLIAALMAAGVPASVGVCPELYCERALAGYAPASPLAVAPGLGQRCINLPVHPTLSTADIGQMATAILRIASEAFT